ncbi:hypothetical protein [Phycisphaera mikurensis]|uniref:hypothetical protein n=1 Tax=Phycisphaera mikurensis TaxID=547188 RepID=UPI00059E5718|nr:hypothetical protein [Phycisphaera mikurensis]MBB6443267.1 hypothetical protein [Phycisphaera mikurensis]
MPFALNFDEALSGDPARFGLTADQAAAYRAVYTPYAAAATDLEVQRSQGLRSKQQTAARDTARDALLKVGRELYATVAANSDVSDQLKVRLGIRLRNGATPVPVPSAAPSAIVGAVRGREVTLRLFDPHTASKRGKAPGAVAAWVQTFVGDQTPADPAGWSFEGATTKYQSEVSFPASAPGGTRVWLRAAWVNGKQQAGPWSDPVSTYLQAAAPAAPANQVRPETEQTPPVRLAA